MAAASQPYRLSICSAREADAALPRARAYLSAAEDSFLRGLTSPKRQRDWLAGRLASKRALATHLREEQGLRLEAREIEVLNEASGRPYCRLGPGREAVARRLSFSISHADPGGLCAVATRGGPIGADWETVAERTEGALELYAAEDERRSGWAAGPSERTRLWALKEAALKLLGVGLAANPLHVLLPPPGSPVPLRPRLEGSARARWEELGSPSIAIETWEKDGAVIAVAHGG